MIADSGAAFATGSIEWEGVLVGSLGCAVDQHSLRVGCFKSGLPIVNYLQATLPDGAAWGSGSGAIFACQVYGPVMCGLSAHASLHFVDAIVGRPGNRRETEGPRSQRRC